VVGGGYFIHRAIKSFHIGRMKNIIYPKPEGVFIIGNAQPEARLGEGVRQVALHGAVGI